jgi:hypothetical protein
MENKEKHKSEIITAEDKLRKRMTRYMTVQFLIERLIEYSNDSSDWEEKLKPIQEKYKEYCIGQDPDGKLRMAAMLGNSLAFVATHPLFTNHEFAEAGARFTDSELKQFTTELHQVIKQPSKRVQIMPYIAAAGLTIIQYTRENDADFAVEVEKRRAGLTEIISASLLKSKLMAAEEKLEKALLVNQQLTQAGLIVDKDGNFDQTNEFYIKAKLREAEHARRKSEKGTSGQSSEGLSTTQENPD